MGCNGSKSVAVVHADDVAPVPSAPAAEDDAEEQPRRASVAASGGDDAEKSPRADPEGSAHTRPVTPQVLPPSMAFDVALDGDAAPGSASIVKRHPPRRLQRLEEQQQQLLPVSLQELQEKQQEAETRRLQFLQLRAQSAKRKYALRNPSASTTAENGTEIVDIEFKEEEKHGEPESAAAVPT